MKPQERKDKNGVISYKLRAYVGLDLNGKKKIVSTTWKPDPKWTAAKTKAELENAQRDFERYARAEAEKARAAESLTPDSSITFQDFAVKFINEYARISLKKSTVNDYEGKIKRVNEAIGHIPLNKFTPIIINKFLANLSEPGIKQTSKTPKGLSPKTIKNFKIMLSSIFTKAVEWRYLSSSPMDKGIVIPKVHKPKLNPLTIDQAKQLINLLINEAPLKYRLFLMTDLAIGARRGEIAGLTWDDIDLDNGTIRIERNLLYNSNDGIYIDTPKTENSYRTNKISPWLVEMFKQYKAEQKPHKIDVDWIGYDFVFIREDGKPTHPNSWYTWFTRFQESHGFRKTTIQEIRHTAPTLLIGNGMPTKLVSGRLGHGSTKTTDDVYADYLQETDEAVNAQMDALLFGELMNNNK